MVFKGLDSKALLATALAFTHGGFANQAMVILPLSCPPAIANMDAYLAQKSIYSGTYRLIPVIEGVAKMDAYLVEMHVLSNG